MLLNQLYCHREWNESKQWLCEKFDCYVSKLSDHSTPFQKILAKVERASAPGKGLILLFGSQTNAITVSVLSRVNNMGAPYY